MHPRLWSPAALLFLALSFTGCKQGDGERCQLDDDCATGHCVLQPGRSPAQGGTCGSATGTTTSDLAMIVVGPDLAAAPDLAMQAAGPDLAPSPDGSAAPDLATAPDLQ